MKDLLYSAKIKNTKDNGNGTMDLTFDVLGKDVIVKNVDMSKDEEIALYDKALKMDKENVKIPKYDQMTYEEILIEKQFLNKQALSCIDIMKMLKKEPKSSRYQSVSGIMWQIVELEEYLKRLC